MYSSPKPISSSAGRQIRTASTDSKFSETIEFNLDPSNVFGLWIPGVSTTIIWKSGLEIIPRIGFLVVFGCLEVITILRPTKAFTRVDLPTFGRPMMATKPALCSTLICQFSHLMLIGFTNSITSDTEETNSATRSMINRWQPSLVGEFIGPGTAITGRKISAASRAVRREPLL